MGRRLEVEARMQGGWEIVTASGEVDLGTVDTLAAALRACGERVALDLTEVTFMDSTGLAAVMVAHQSRVDGGAFGVVSESGPVRRLLSVSGVDRVIHVGDSLGSIID